MSVAMSVPVAFVAAMFVIFVAAVTMPTATLSMPMAMVSVPVATVAMSVTSMAFFTVSVPAATAAALGGGDVRVYQLKLLPISHVSSFNPATRARSLG